MSLFSTSIKAFFHNPIKFVFDPDYLTEYQIVQAANAGVTKEQIEKVLVKSGYIKGSPILSAVKFVQGVVDVLAKNLPYIVILIFGLFALYYLTPIFRKR